MKKNLIEELKRIHTITYGENVVNESFLSDLLKTSNKKPEEVQKVDVETTADYITNDVNKFLDILKGVDHPIFQQRLGNMQRQTQVEAVQIALELLGYHLPIHGVDGLFGPETASAVNKYKKDNNITDKDTIEESSIPMRILIESALIHEAALMEPVPMDSSSVTSPFGAKRSYETHPGVDLKAKSGTPVKSPAEGIVTKAGETPRCGGTIIIKHGSGFQSGFCHIKDIKVTQGQNVTAGDIIGLSGGAANDSGKGNSMGAHLHFTLRKDGQLVNPLNYIGKGGYDFTKSNSSSVGSTDSESIISPDMVDNMVAKLLTKNLKPTDLDPFIDKATTTGGGVLFTDLDLTTLEGQSAYSEICDKFIRTRPPNLLGIRGEMLTQGAKNAFQMYHKYVPPELALAQLATEGGIGNSDPKSRPIRTKNPFNVGNVDTGANSYKGTVQQGIDTYYNLIARNYLVKGKTASDLVNNFVNKDNQRYATEGDYERVLNKIANQANRIAAPIYASLNNKKSTDNYA
jgi:peptidoglycan hydrolase-like protein with peptidoglycan-binding domain